MLASLASPCTTHCIPSLPRRSCIALAANFSRPSHPLLDMDACSSGRVSRCQYDPIGCIIFREISES